MPELCYPISVLPHITPLYADYLGLANAAPDALLRRWYGSEPLATGWMRTAVTVPSADRLADALRSQNSQPAALANIEKLRAGARAVVTGQQVALFGGPLLTLLKAATAVARAREATQRTGIDHVPVFWLASEDHDLLEVDQLALPGPSGVETLHLGLKHHGPVGELALSAESLDPVLARAAELLAWAPVADLLRECYTPGTTLAAAFAKLIETLFAPYGLVVLDAAGSEFHSLGAPALRYAIEHAAELEAALLARTSELESAGYHAQVLIVPGHSLLFLIDAESRDRLPLRRTGAEGQWKAGGRSYSVSDLLQILEATPELLSPNALLRPVFQDTILPTAAYIGGPAEIAYFAQSEVVYRAILGRLTPVLPRFSATLIEPAVASLLDRHETDLPTIFQAKTTEEMCQRLGARAMPIEGKRKLAAVGNAMDRELSVLTEYLDRLDPSLGRSAAISGNKMRYQMNRLRRMAATFELQKEASLRKHAGALMLNLFPDAHPQERLLGGVWFLARNGEDLIGRLVDEAARMCVGHTVVRL